MVCPLSFAVDKADRPRLSQERLKDTYQGSGLLAVPPRQRAGQWHRDCTVGARRPRGIILENGRVVKTEDLLGQVHNETCPCDVGSAIRRW